MWTLVDVESTDWALVCRPFKIKTLTSFKLQAPLMIMCTQYESIQNCQGGGATFPEILHFSSVAYYFFCINKDFSPHHVILLKFQNTSFLF